MDASEWDQRYAATELLWSDTPNQFVKEYFERKQPGTVADLGAGEGRNSIWLARQGWNVVAVDFSSVALERTAALAEKAGVAIKTVNDNLVTWESPAVFDAIVICYIHLPKAMMAKLWKNAFHALVPGGELLIVGHHTRNLTEGTGGPQSAEVLFAPSDVVEVLGKEAIVEAKDVFRNVEVAGATSVAIDTYVVAQNRS